MSPNDEQSPEHHHELLDARQTDLEIKVMDLENTLAELNAVIIRQAQDIDTLRANQRRLRGQLQALEQRGNQSDADEPPPHY